MNRLEIYKCISCLLIFLVRHSVCFKIYLLTVIKRLGNYNNLISLKYEILQQ